MKNIISLRNTPSNEQFNIIGDGVTKNTTTLQKALDACGDNGGGTVRIGPGRYLTGPLYLRSHVTLHLEEGAEILGSQDKDDYNIVKRRHGGIYRSTREALINAEDQVDICISGRGTIDGQGAFWWKQNEDSTNRIKKQLDNIFAQDDWCHDWEQIMTNMTDDDIRNNGFHRPVLVEFVRCKHVLIKGVTLQNSGFWNLHPLLCKNVRIQNVTILNPYEAPNTDGLDIDSCSDVLVSDCFLDVGDDCICLKSGIDEESSQELVPTENVLINNCIIHGGHGGVVFGSEISGGIRNVAISNCVFNGTCRGIRVKCRTGKGGVVENISASNIIMSKVPSPFDFCMHNAVKLHGKTTDNGTSQFRNIRFSNIIASEAVRAGHFHGAASRPITGLSFCNVKIEAQVPIWQRHLADPTITMLEVVSPDGSIMPSFTDGKDIIVDPLLATD